MEDTLSYVDRLYASSNRIDGLYYMAARALGISENMLSLLYALLDGRPRSQKQICEELLIPKTTLNTVTRECLAAGHISLGEGKEKLIELTPSRPGIRGGTAERHVPGREGGHGPHNGGVRHRIRGRCGELHRTPARGI